MDGLGFFYYDTDVVLLARRCFLALCLVPRRRYTSREDLESFLYTLYELDRAASASAGAAAVSMEWRM